MSSFSLDLALWTGMFLSASLDTNATKRHHLCEK